MTALGLALFDIDATMVRSNGLGVRAMEEAADELFGPADGEHEVEYAGRLDPLIMRDLAAARGAAPTPAEFARFRAVYTRRFGGLLTQRRGAVRALAGVRGLLDALSRESRVTLGVLTGNFAETGGMKLDAAGIGVERFVVRVWGDASPNDPPSREDLPPVGMTLHERLVGARVEAQRVTIIGDTPHDVACAKAHGCRAIAVATGRFSRQSLETAGADLALDDLTNTEGITRWITTGAMD